MRLALVGYGAVAAIHARQLRPHAGVRLTAVCGPDAAKAREFAREQGIDQAVESIDGIRGLADAAVVCSPSGYHFKQARALLQAGVSTLVEVPACGSRAEAEELARLADTAGVTLRCAHTSHYIEPSRRIGDVLARQGLGAIRQVHYVRTVAPRRRTWTDDALLHHAAHPLHLLLSWFPNARLLGCATHPGVVGAQHVSILAACENGAPVSISVSYQARVPAASLLIVGEDHTISTDGFSRIESDLPGENWTGDLDATYHDAIGRQDAEFIQACQGKTAGIPWSATIALAAVIDQLRDLAAGGGHTPQSGLSRKP